MLLNGRRKSSAIIAGLIFSHLNGVQLVVSDKAVILNGSKSIWVCVSMLMTT